MSCAGDAHRIGVFPRAPRQLTPPASWSWPPTAPFTSSRPRPRFHCSRKRVCREAQATATSLPRSRPTASPHPRCRRPRQNDYDCPSPPPSSNGSRHLVTPLVVTAFVVVFLFLASLSIYCFIRRRRLRRQQQQSLLAGVQADGPQLAAAAATDVGAGAPEDEAVQHHAWHIRTVGLDEAAIESIALTRYRAGTTLAAADCPVCLGEFLDGELLRLLPRCAHAFHAPCIATWLRAHVNCPLCRAHVVLDESAHAGDSNASPADADADAEQVSSDTETLDHEQLEVRVQIDQRDQLSSPEPQRRRTRDFRRVVSMDPSVVSSGQVPEDKQSSKGNQGNGGGAACCEVPSGSGRLCQMKRSLSGGGRWPLGSRHRRARSSLLPA